MPAVNKAIATRKKRVTPRRFDLAFRPASYRWPRKRANDAGAPREVVIARVAFSTPQGDTVTVRAKRTDDGRIRYRMVHEDAHGGARHRVRVKPASSDRPLTLEALVSMLETAQYSGACPDPDDQTRFGGIIWGTLACHFEHGVDHAEDYLFFTTVTSEHYPDLEPYYRERISQWCLDKCEEEEDCKRVVRLRLRRR